MDVAIMALPDAVERIRGGDAAAERSMRDHFSPRIAFLARRDPRAAPLWDDVRAETLDRTVAAIRAGRLSSAEALPGFVLQMTRQVIQEFVKQHQLLISTDDLSRGVGTAATAGLPLRDPDAGDALRRALARLRAKERLFLRLHFYEELSRGEIGRRMDLNEMRLRVVKSTALRRMRAVQEQVLPASPAASNRAAASDR